MSISEKKIENIAYEEIENEQDKGQLFLLLKNYGVAMKGDILDYDIDQLRESCLKLKKMAEEKAAQIAEQEKPQDPYPDLTEEAKDNPLAEFHKIGFVNKEDLLQNLQSISKREKELKAKAEELIKHGEETDAKLAKLDQKSKQIQQEQLSLAEECKRNKEQFSRLQEAKKAANA